MGENVLHVAQEKGIRAAAETREKDGVEILRPGCGFGDTDHLPAEMPMHALQVLVGVSRRAGVQVQLILELVSK